MQKIHQELEDDFVILGVDFKMRVKDGAAFFFEKGEAFGEIKGCSGWHGFRIFVRGLSGFD